VSQASAPATTSTDIDRAKDAHKARFVDAEQVALWQRRAFAVALAFALARLVQKRHSLHVVVVVVGVDNNIAIVAIARAALGRVCDGRNGFRCVVCDHSAHRREKLDDAKDDHRKRCHQR
jgi:hypothetical protein